MHSVAFDVGQGGGTKLMCYDRHVRLDEKLKRHGSQLHVMQFVGHDFVSTMVMPSIQDHLDSHPSIIGIQNGSNLQLLVLPLSSLSDNKVPRLPRNGPQRGEMHDSQTNAVNA